MKDLMIGLGSMLPVEFTIGELKKSIEEWETDKTQDNQKKVEMFCLLLLSKAAAEAHKDGAVGLMNQLDKHEKMIELVDPERKPS